MRDVIVMDGEMALDKLFMGDWLIHSLTSRSWGLTVLDEGVEEFEAGSMLATYGIVVVKDKKWREGLG